MIWRFEWNDMTDVHVVLTTTKNKTNIAFMYELLTHL